MPLRATIRFTITEAEVKSAAESHNKDVGKMPPEWFSKVVDETNDIMRAELFASIYEAVAIVDDPEKFEDIDHNRADRFMEWIERQTMRRNEYLVSRGGHAHASITGMKDGVVSIEIAHGAGALDDVTATIYIEATALNDTSIEFERLYAMSRFW